MELRGQIKQGKETHCLLQEVGMYSMPLTLCLFYSKYVLGAGGYLVSPDFPQKNWLGGWGGGVSSS